MSLLAFALAMAVQGHSRRAPVIAPPPLIQMPPPVITPTVPTNVTPFSTIGGWAIDVDPSIGAGCFLSTTYVEGTQLRLGFDQIRGNAYILLGNPAWRTLQPGYNYHLEMQIDTRDPWGAEAVGFRFPSGGMVYLNTTFTRPEFLTEFIGGHVLTVTYQGRTVAQLRLDGADSAARELLRCQQANPRPDPFQGTPPAADPFRPSA